MPEMFFTVRWPDGGTMRCYSPSLVIEDYLAAGASYAVSEFVERSTGALAIASDRVERKYGFPCSRARAASDAIRDRARSASDGAAEDRVTVVSFESAR